MSPSPQRVLIATAEPLGRRAAGPAIRARHIAEELGKVGHEVTLASTAPAHVRADSDGISVMGDVAVHGDYDVIVLQGRVLLEHPELHQSTACIVVDLYDPFQLEALHRGGTDRIRRIDLGEGALLTLADQLARGDYFLCSSERQRDFWLGHLSAAGRLNAATHAQDPTLRTLLDVVSFGISETPPVGTGSSLREAHGFNEDDPVLLWAGGMHDWLDPLTLVDAVDIVRRSAPNIRLVFWGASHPNTELDVPVLVAATQARAEALGLWGDHVVFHPEWVPYAERGGLLLDATIGVSTQHDHLETRFSYRTRLLDHLWAGLPTVATGGDPLVARLEAAGAARTCAPEDPNGLAEQILALVKDPEALAASAAAAKELRNEMTWHHTLAPLVAYIDAPERAADLTDRTIAPIVTKRRPKLPYLPARYVERARRHVAERGPTEVVRRGLGKLGRGRL